MNYEFFTTFASAFQKCYKVLFYGVMAALGFLVPSVQVRILVEQPIFLYFVHWTCSSVG